MSQARQIATRLSCFAIISAIEQDLREEIMLAAARSSVVELLPHDVRNSAGRRWKDNSSDLASLALESDIDLLEYTNFADIAKILHKIMSSFPEGSRNSIGDIAEGLERLTDCRNRVCHSRPLEIDDLPSLLDFAETLLRPGSPWPMKTTKGTIEKLREDPSFVLHLTIPPYWSADTTTIQHNLPLPEFDDTGFLGRVKDRREVARLLLSPHPVITIVGEGGVGKTALALRCLYDILEAAENPFDAIIWTSLKTRALAPEGIKELEGTIETVLGVVRNVADELGVPRNGQYTQDGLLDEIRHYMQEFRILLTIDNVETLAQESLRPLLSAIPPGSKVLLTSRVGLGEIELRYALDALDEGTAAVLMRRFASSVNLASIAHLQGDTLKSYCKSLFMNPLLIKWFVSAVAAGANPSSILAKGGESFVNAVRFCFENLFERLTVHEKEILHVLASAKGPVSQAELAFMTPDLTRDQLEWALNTLHHSSMLRRTLSGDTAQSQMMCYALTEIAFEYISKCAPPPRDVFKRVRDAMQSLQGLVEGSRVRMAAYKFSVYTIQANTRDEKICATYLHRALKELKAYRFDEAIRLVNQAKSLLPNSAENYRVAAIVESNRGDEFRAAEEYRHALSLAPKSELVLYSYSQFLIQHLDDYAGALKIIDELVKLVSDEPTIQTVRALCLTRLGRYFDATQIYKKLLGDINQRPKKWRITTKDQAAECYRRFMEQDLTMRDDGGFFEHLKSALEILDDAIRSGDNDHKTADRLSKVISVGQRGASAFHDQRIGELLANFTGGLEKFRTGLPIAPRLIPEEEFSSRPQGLLKEGQAAEGAIKVIIPVGKGYGFITADDGSDWFFHKGSLILPLKWDMLTLGKRVKFMIGRNSKGLCAEQVRTY